jgi:hypothetical protein
MNVLNCLICKNSEKNLSWIVSENAGATRILRPTVCTEVIDPVKYTVQICNVLSLLSGQIDDNINEVQFKIQFKHIH